MNRRSFITGLVTLGLVSYGWPAEAGNAKKALAQKAWQRLLARDAARDAASKAKPLRQSKRVWRYTTHREAKGAAKKGLSEGRHMTSGVRPGRPMSGTSAQSRYGLSKRPEVRMTIELPKGQPIRRNKVLGGERGVGEITSTERIPPSAIRRIISIE